MALSKMLQAYFDTNGYGPETMTIGNASTGTSYAYYVYNYSSPTLVNCGAVATIYDSDGNKVVVNINDASGTNTSHKNWHICNFNSSKNIKIKENKVIRIVKGE